MSNKTCSTCKERLPLESFHRRSSSIDGRSRVCKECRRIYRRQYYLENKERELELNRQYVSKNKSKVESYKNRWRRKNPKLVAKAAVRLARMSGKQENAHTAVYYAVEAGDLDPVSNKACAGCGRDAHHYHHEDYHRPLDVIPLCASCHALYHHRGQSWKND